MGSRIHTVEDFLDDFEAFRLHCIGLDYSGVKNPVDGITYPGISLNIPPDSLQEVADKLATLEQRNIQVNTMFLRQSPEHTCAPHQAHTDTVMGARSLMLYLNKKEDCQGGTSFVVHRETGMYSDPQTDREHMAWARDTNNPQAWDILAEVKMVSNRGLIFDSYRMHRAEPVGGFGTTNENSRLVLTAFYS